MPISEIIILAALALYIVVFALFHWDGRGAILVALGLLVVTAITLALGRSDVANQLAIYAYYFLAAGVIVILIEHLRLVPESWSRRCRALLTSNNREVFGTAAVLAKRLEMLPWGSIGAGEKNQLIEAQAIQDGLRERSEGWQYKTEIPPLVSEKVEVLDTSVVLGWFSPAEACADKALEIRQAIIDGKTRVIIPEIVLYEVAAALRSNPHLCEDDVIAAIRSVNDMSVNTGIRPSALITTATRLASRHGISIYDAFKVALAREIGADFVTADKKLYESTKRFGFVRLIGNVDGYQATED